MTLTVHPLHPSRVGVILESLCDEDKAELRRGDIDEADVAIVDVLPQCTFAHELRWAGQPVAMYGLRRLGPDAAAPWMLTTTGMREARRADVARLAVREVAKMRESFPLLLNLIDAEHRSAIRFVQWLGFTVEPQRFGPRDAFLQFHWRRQSV